MSATAVGVVAGILAGLATGWAVAVPLHRYKELRPLTPRTVASESHLAIRAVYRHAACPRCHHHSSAREWTPVVSWFRGCPVCSLRAPATLIACQTALPLALGLNALSFSRVEDPWSYGALLVAYGSFVVLAVAVAVVDARVWLIPWWMPWASSVVGLVLLGAAAMVLGEPERIVWAVASGCAVLALFFVLFLAAPGKLGFGDVRLVAPIGLFTGFIDPLLALWALIIGSLIGVVVGVLAAVRGRGGHFAFGPALAGGALVAIWLSESLV